jgi:uncharacterized lipoprotein YbaY
MAQARRIQGEIVFPADARQGVAQTISVELRDVSLQDQPSTVLAATTLKGVSIGPNSRVPFEFVAPASPGDSSLSLRVQVDMQTGQRHASGDYLSTASQPVAPTGDALQLVVPVTRL